MSILIRNAALWSDGGYLPGNAILIDGGTIAAVGDESDLLDRPGEGPFDVIDAEGALVTPTFADATTTPPKAASRPATWTCPAPPMPKSACG